MRTNRGLRSTAVVFDIGGVLLDWHPRHLCRKLFGDEESMERFLEGICTPVGHEPHDRREPTEDACARLADPEVMDRAWR